MPVVSLCPRQFSEAVHELEGDTALQPPCLHANLVFPNGEFGEIVVEVQLHLFDIMKVKKESHKLYEVERAANMATLLG